jgi:glycosyltransferase involved in cell wall biosynthesis
MRTIALLYDSVLNIGGVESHLLSILEKRDPSRYGFVVISDASQNFREKVQALSAEIISINRRHPLNPFTPFILARILRRKNIDLIHAHSPIASLWGRIAAFLLKIPFIVTVHLPVDQYHGEMQTIRSRLGRKIYTVLDHWLNHRQVFTRKIIYVAEQVYEREIAEGHSPDNRSILIPNGVDLSRYAHIDRETARGHFNLLPNTKIVVFVGRLDEQKGVDILIQSVIDVNLQDIDFRLWLIGGGPLRDDLQDQVHNLGLSDIVTFWGYQDEIPLFLKASDIFVLPSRYEGMSFALLEGMAVGLPCVVTQVGENNRMIRHGVHGLVGPTENPTFFAEALTTLLLDPNLCGHMAENVAKHARQYSDDRMVEQIERVYNECLEIQ